MTRVPLVPDESADEVTASVFEAFHAEGREPIALYRALANAPICCAPTARWRGRFATTR